MLIKEYRILLPLTTEEYRIAQLFMIQKKSRLESSGAGSGVEIIKNEPYEDGNCSNDSGQYTYKVYHIGNRIPMWIRNVLPSSALEAHEEAWNSYPYTRTRYSCPLITHFSVDVETRYLDDAGRNENIFNLSQDELKQRNIDVIDFVKDTISSHDYIVEEDPKLYKSIKTGRGPLNDNWVEEHIRQGKPVMCAYKLCKVEFKYWGLQTRAERWIHDLALRNTMLRAHRQAWAWQDEWFGLTIEDIRQLEDETQKYLCTLMSTTTEDGNEKDTIMVEYLRNGLILNDKSVDREKMERNEENANCEEDSTSTNSDDIFFDCTDKVPEDASNKSHKPTLVRWSSELLVNEDDLEKSPPRTPRPSNKSLLILVFHGDLFPKTSADSKITDIKTFRSTLESLISGHFSQLKNRLHVQCVTCGSELGQLAQLLNGLCSSSFGTFHPSLGPILASDSQNFMEAVNSTVINANRIVSNFLASDEGQLSENEDHEIFVVGDFIGGILMYEALARTAALRLEIVRNNNREKELTASLQSSPALMERQNRAGDGTISTHSHQSLSAGPIAPRGSAQIFNFKNKTPNQILQNKEVEFVKNNSAPPSATPCGQNSFNTSLYTPSSPAKRRQSQTSIETFSFRPSTAFLFGCPLAFVLIQKKLIESQQNLSLACDQLFNLYYTLDLCAARLEPVLNSNLALLPAPKVPRYQRFNLISNTATDPHDLAHQSDNAFLETPMIWGNRRVDHELYSPPEMSSLPALALPSILHASYWESKDVGAFVIRQFLRFDEIPCPILTLKNMIDQPPLQFQMPLTVWNRRRTRFKIANLAANHRANDVIVVDGGEEQLINARFCYGPMDLVVLSHENVLVYVLPAGGEWFLRGVETTDKNGRLTINLGKTLPIGIHHVRLIVQGDHTFLSVSMAIVPPGTPIVVFSIDGSLTASVSVTGRDPRLRPGAVDVVRFWQQQGYLIIYLTARLDMQQRLVSTWLATHNFPHGLLFFTPSLSTEPLRQKMQFMKHLADIRLCIQAAYGSAKDVSVYANAGLNAERIFKVGGHHRRRQTGNYVSLDNGYSTHLHDLHSGRVEIAQPAVFINPFSSTAQSIHFGGASLDETSTIEQKIGQNPQQSPRNRPIQRTLSFGPRTGKYYCSKKISQTSVISSNY